MWSPNYVFFWGGFPCDYLIFFQLCLSSFLIECNEGQEQLVGIVLGSLSCLMQRRGFEPPLRRIFFCSRDDFSLGVNMGSDSVPPKLFRMRV